MSIKERVVKNIIEKGLFHQGQGIVVGVSGGPDSICLLHLLHSLREQFDIKLYAAHLNHNFRGDDSREDASYVESICGQWGIDVFSQSIDVNALCRQQGLGPEEGGRFARYQLFERVKSLTGAHKIAVAQNLNDQAETVMMRFIRGTGLQGLAAMDFMRDEYIIRPLLNVSRQEIEEYCFQHNLGARIDKSNMETIYTRNKIRLELIPYIKENFNSNIIDTLVRQSDLMRDDNSYLDKASLLEYDKSVQIEGQNYLLDINKFLKQDIAIKRRIIIKIGEKINRGVNPFESKHIEDIILFCLSNKTGKSLDMPSSIKCSISYGKLIFSKVILDKASGEDFTCCIDINHSVVIESINSIVITKIIPYDQYRNMSHGDKYTAFFNATKVKSPLVIRNRREGDRFLPSGMTGSKKLKDFFIDNKIPREKRDSIPLVITDNDIMWVAGYRTSEKFKVDETTDNVLMIEIKKNGR